MLIIQLIGDIISNYIAKSIASNKNKGCSSIIPAIMIITISKI